MIIHFIIIAFVATIIALILTLFTFFFSSKESRNKNIWTSSIAPIVGLYTLYIFGLFGSIIVSTIKDIDVGIGDAWYVPLPDNCQLLFIDIPELAYIQNNDEPVISGVSHLQQIEDQIIGISDEGIYFTYNTSTKELLKYSSSNELISKNLNLKIRLDTAIHFYYTKKDEIAGLELNIVYLSSIIISLFSIFLTRKLIVKLIK